MIERVADLDGAAEEIARIEQHCFSTPWSEKQIRESNDRTVFFIARQAGQAVGYAGMYTVLDEGYVTNIGVLPDRRRQGIGRRLVDKLIEYSKAQELSFLSLEVRPGNDAAIRLYQSFGFEQAGRRKNFYSHPTEDGIIMTRYFR